MAKPNGLKRLSALVVSCGAAGLAGYAALTAYAASRLLIPKRRYAYGVTPALYGMQFQDVFFPARGGDVSISGWFIPSAGSQRAVVLVHGKDVSRVVEFFGRFLEVAQGLHQRGFNVLMIDLRGHGMSGPGRFTFGGDERRDVLGAVDWLLGRGFAPGQVGLLGVSLGSAACLAAAAEEPAVGAVVSDSGFAEFLPLVRANWRHETGLPVILLPGVMRAARWIYKYRDEQAHPALLAGQIRGALLIIHGDEDRVIPPFHASLLAAVQPRAETWSVPGAAHAFCYGTQPEEYLERVSRFFNQNLMIRV